VTARLKRSPELSSREHFNKSHRAMMDSIHAFNEIQAGPNPLTPEEVAALLKKRPAVYGKFTAWAKNTRER
jgi:hypothetical protein